MPVITARAIRAAIAAAFAIDSEHVFSATRCLGPQAGQPAGRLAPLMLAATIAASPHMIGRVTYDGGDDRQTYLLKRTKRICELRPNARATKLAGGAGRLPHPLDFVGHDSIPLIVLLEILLEVAHTDPFLACFAVRDEAMDAYAIPADALTFSLHGGALHPRMALQLTTVSGIHFETVFTDPADTMPPAADALALRVSVGIRGLIEFARLLDGDTSAESRIAARVSNPLEPMYVVDPHASRPHGTPRLDGQRDMGVLSAAADGRPRPYTRRGAPRRTRD